MAFQTKDKQKSFGSAYKTKRYDAFHSQEDKEPTPKTGVAKPSEPKEESRTDEKGQSKKAQPAVNDTSNTKAMNMGNKAPEHEGSMEESRTDMGGESNVPPQDTVNEHGPAHSVTVHHDHANNKHHVFSHHADGHMSHSTHASAPDAHSHAAQLAGNEGGNTEPENDSQAANPNMGDLSSIFGGE
jgi:hypothetical protein